MFEAHAMLSAIMLGLCVVDWSSSHAAKQLKSYLPRVHHGRDAQPGEYTFVVVFIQNIEPDVHRTFTGSMISPQWVLTCAHASRHDIATMVVWYGNFTDSPWQSKLYTKILKMYTHRSYREIVSEKGHLIRGIDMALYQVQEKADLHSFGRLSAVDYTTLIGLPVTYVGGGGTDRLDGDELRALQVGEGATVPCDTSVMQNMLICVVSKCSKRVEQIYFGDSGGPLLYDGKIIGVAISLHRNKLIKMFGFAPVSPFLDWIYEVMSTGETRRLKMMD